MNIRECSPLKARQVFTISQQINLGIGFGVFALIFLPLMFCLNVWIASGIAIVPALVIYLYYESRVIFIECPSCQKLIDTNTPWTCGYKQCRNENAVEFPFIYKCEHCHYPPKSYECHHCKKLIYLTPDRQQIHSAKCLVVREPVKAEIKHVVKDVIGDKKLSQADKISDLTHERDAAKLKKQIEIINNTSSTVQPPTSSVETAMKEMEDHVNQGMSDGEAEAMLRATVDIKYAADDHKRMQAHALINEAAQRRFEKRG